MAQGVFAFGQRPALGEMRWLENRDTAPGQWAYLKGMLMLGAVHEEGCRLEL